MKTVFNSHSQLAHIWAQQTQSSGRSSNMFFDGARIFSYGYHYCIAKIHTRKGKRFALVNSNGYSNSTAKHTSRTINALAGLMPYYYSPDVSDTNAAIREADAAARAELSNQLRCVKVTDREDIAYKLERVSNAFKEANELRKFLGKAKLVPNKKLIASLKPHLEARLKRYLELQSPEMVAKRKRQAELREARLTRKLELELQSHILTFRKGEGYGGGLSKLPYEILRVKGDTVETSRGAKVPLDQAKLLLGALLLNKPIDGKAIGSFRVNNVMDLASGDKAVRIGCHRILMSEARSVLGGQQ